MPQRYLYLSRYFVNLFHSAQAQMYILCVHLYICTCTCMHARHIHMYICLQIIRYIQHYNYPSLFIIIISWCEKNGKSFIPYCTLSLSIYLYLFVQKSTEVVEMINTRFAVINATFDGFMREDELPNMYNRVGHFNSTHMNFFGIGFCFCFLLLLRLRLKLSYLCAIFFLWHLRWSVLSLSVKLYPRYCKKSNCPRSY